MKKILIKGGFIVLMTALLAVCDGGVQPTPHTHQWGAWSVTSPATCTTKGVETRVCALNTTHKQKQDIAIAPHDWEQLNGIAPTCTADGSGTRKCSFCAKEETLDVIPALGHNYAWVITTAPTCTTAGVETGTCTHDTTHTSFFPIPIDPNAHNWGNNWTITTPPTTVKAGTETDTCTYNTSHTRTRPITAATFTSITDLDTYLSGLSGNTAAAAYTVKLNVNSLDDAASTSGSVVAILRANSTKFVSLDLSGSTLTSIEDDAFNGLANLAGIILPSGVTSIGDRSFNRCTNLTSLNIPDGVTSIGGTAFNDCRSLTSITIPNSITSIGDGAFSFCASLASITIPNKVTSIGFGVYQRCDSLTSIIIPNSVTSIGEKAFNTNAKLTSVTFQGTIASGNFHNDAFQNDGDLRDKFYATNSTNGTPGTYTTTAPVSASSVWTKQ